MTSSRNSTTFSLPPIPSQFLTQNIHTNTNNNTTYTNMNNLINLNLQNLYRISIGYLYRISIGYLYSSLKKKIIKNNIKKKQSCFILSATLLNNEPTDSRKDCRMTPVKNPIWCATPRQKMVRLKAANLELENFKPITNNKCESRLLCYCCKCLILLYLLLFYL
eukprot:UN11931